MAESRVNLQPILEQEKHGLKLLQPTNGYRFSADALLLANFAVVPAGGRVIDLGCGCGIIALLLAQRPKVRSVVGLELQPELAQLARENVRQNYLEDKVSIVEGDLRQVADLFKRGEFDALVSNPPYWQVGTGRINPNPNLAMARHELQGNMTQLLQAGAYLVRPKGKINLIYPVHRLAELWECLICHQLQPKRLKFVHATPQAQASLFMLSASPLGQPGLVVLPPEWLPKIGKAV
jgi:tRNA1Val (adenine37-N6)-methyltransferase